MEKLRVEKDNVYKIEVNDKGECIEFDLLDIELPIKLINASEELKKQKEIYKEKIEKLKNENLNPAEDMLKQYEIDKEFCQTMRNVLDSFLGENACQKIFGDTNRIGMFDDFFTQLEPHLDKIIINVEQVKKDLIEKYKPMLENKI
jgi:hypothetical protein